MSDTAASLGYLESAKTASTAADINAQMALARGAAESERIRRVGRRQEGAIVAAVGKAGVTLSGSARLAMAEAIRVSREDAMAAEFTAQRSAMARRLKGKSQVTAARSKIASSILSDATRGYVTYKEYE